MEGDVGNRVEYWLSVDQVHKSSLYDLRNWAHLKIASDEHLIWVRGFTNTEIGSVKVLSIPSAKRYCLQGTKLYLLGHRLPYRVEPSLLWTEIQRGLSLNLPQQNFNYFGLNQAHSISIVPSDKIYTMNVTIVQLDLLCAFVRSAASIRMESLKWTIIDDQQALIIGTPLLPISGEDYYTNGCFIIPGGYKLKYGVMLATYEKSLLGHSDCWYIIDEKNEMRKINRSEFTILNKGSVLQSMNLINQMSDMF